MRHDNDSSFGFRNRGVTLIELGIDIMLLAAVPSFMNMIDMKSRRHSGQ